MLNKNIIQVVVGPIATNCWIYPTGAGEAAIIDPGDDADEIIDALEKHSLVPKYILLTHGHFDHICAVPEIKRINPETIQIGIHDLDSKYLGSDSYEVHRQSIKAAMGISSILDLYWKGDLPPADILLEEGSLVGPFSVLHLPGHSQGSVAFWDKQAGVLFTGDTLFKDGYGRTDLPGGNEAVLFESLKRLCAMDPGINVFPGHGEVTTIELERS
jgi:glyoxylase-like metal-dependent hydrolase (beta-lactamase superfamily II)